EVHALSKIDPWFLHKIKNLVEMEQELIARSGALRELLCRTPIDTYRSTMDTYRSPIDTHRTPIDTYQSSMDTYQSASDTYQSATDTLRLGADTDCLRADLIPDAFLSSHPHPPIPPLPQGEGGDQLPSPSGRGDGGEGEKYNESECVSLLRRAKEWQFSDKFLAQITGLSELQVRA
ncbi:MAG: hypothetical protein RMM07_14345, partial [Anaerolineae bacterium]|nr:hypothetical protein [Anaerolineae bacterium]